jgi:hypothetical protein
VAASKGYGFVPLADRVHRVPRPHAVFHRCPKHTVSVAFGVTYKAVQPICIGTGCWTIHGQTAVRMAARSGNRPVIPGSSMKGVLRARYEAMTKSCCGGEKAPQKKQNLSRTLPSRTFPDHLVAFDDAISKNEVFSRCRPQSGMCAGCALFGVMSLRGRVAVHDLLAPENVAFEARKIPIRFSPRPHHLGRFTVDSVAKRLNVGKLSGRKFHLGGLYKADGGEESAEVIPSGTLLTGRVVCTNVTSAELGGLMSAMGWSPFSALKIGSAKAYQFGQISLEGVRVEFRGDVPDDLLEQAGAAFVESADYHEGGEKQLITMHGGRWPCR